MRLRWACWVSVASLVTITACADSHDGIRPAGSYDPPCGEGSIEWTDEQCFRNDASREERCMPRGDGLCYEHCEEDADCTDSGRPHCAELKLDRGGVGACIDPIGEIVWVCRDMPYRVCEL
ncbi:MAG: hypothetical protein DRJ42_00310 [Deltaproteobacteria bacterium]|nr:MAG: hypothetical protein DRJ42_00310 [Deltaproteobacteria bacterium]